ncbi:MAG: uroporphyrinogen decarboxylase family protein [Spirochaetota bacterium]
MITPKQRMLNAYRGLPNDRPAIAPEFWYYYPAKVLGVDMIRFEKDIPLWQALLTTFKKYGTEGWGAAFAAQNNPHTKGSSREERLADGRLRHTNTISYKDKSFTSVRMYDKEEPSWTEKYLLDDAADIGTCVEMATNTDITFDLTKAVDAHRTVGNDYLLEFWLGTPFFDFIAGFMGFEKAVMYFIEADEKQLHQFRERYLSHQMRLIREACRTTPYESFVFGCSYSCNSLIGPVMWRQWDKPFIKAIADELHAHGKLLHIHFHGKSMECASDFSETGIDCVCPFERSPGGDVDGVQGLRDVRKALADKVTMNGNVHTVETLIRGTPDDVRREVREIKEAFAGSNRFIIGTGDQVGRETPEENILAMIDEGKS